MIPPRRSFQMTAVGTMKLVAFLGLALGASRLLHGTYYEEYIRLQSQLDRIDGITGIEIRSEDDITYEVHSVRFCIGGHPDAVVIFDEPDLDAGLLDRPRHLYIRRLGPWEFHQARYGRVGASPDRPGPATLLAVSSAIDVGPRGPFAAMLPCRIENAKDVVANYDSLVKTFASWPDETTWGVLDESPGIQTAFCRTSIGTGRPLPSPPQFPRLW
ncbi:hypothetical protein [Paludisphaera mucosa]|uniref:Uncharacterized protein n=1 Tax=Paludisphaera mucosa TaxID=3030827 RepID=A0ABT6FAH5_9BACT|nr:hypothetical protein [Paludisphaera mucosa]MDG3004481.1 hypothetical protein [Paludisphaera mucosa]